MKETNCEISWLRNTLRICVSVCSTVTIDTVVSEGEQRVSANLMRKAVACDKMFTALVGYMNDAMRVEKSEYTNNQEVPAWLAS